MKQAMLLILVILLIFAAVPGCTQTGGTGDIQQVSDDDYRIVTDSRGVKVKLPVDIERVATVSYGLVEEVMYILGVDDRIVAIGSEGLLSSAKSGYSYPLDDGTNVTAAGGNNVATILSPGLDDLPLFVDYGVAMNYETLAAADPDVVILRLGSSAFLSCEDENAEKSIEKIESLGIPVVVLYSPNCYEDSDPTAISDEIEIIGRVFGKEDEAEDIAAILESMKNDIQERTASVGEDEKKDVLVLGLSSSHRTETAAGIAWGLKTTESYMIENLINARNSFRSDAGSFQVINTEQILSMDPDVIILGTASGYHPPGELYNATYYKNLRELRAVKDHNVSSLPYAPRNAAKRLEYPIDLMVTAKAVYPELFEDVDLNGWILSFYQKVYGVDSGKAAELRSAQLMDWCIGE
ncbi:ABC transporter substrate-binding protein [Methanolacinia petrolearia]|uniref:ABC transporter substrate-binding protein n=1 Tax=Methanolacinia petrolearia TaxID=54120 RepID=UPI003BAA3CBC